MVKKTLNPADGTLTTYHFLYITMLYFDAYFLCNGIIGEDIRVFYARFMELPTKLYTGLVDYFFSLKIVPKRAD